MKTKKFIKRKVFQNENTLYRSSWADCLFWSYILTLIEILRCVTSSDCFIYRKDKTLLQSQYEHKDSIDLFSLLQPRSQHINEGRTEALCEFSSVVYVLSLCTRTYT